MADVVVADRASELQLDADDAVVAAHDDQVDLALTAASSQVRHRRLVLLRVDARPKPGDIKPDS